MGRMSVEPGAKFTGEPSAAQANLDLTGLPAPVADELRRLVKTLRDNLGRQPVPGADPSGESPDQWSRRLQAWVDSHPVRAVTLDESRESIYAGRGE
jgi:hypothetical protein